jgi:hypothetical protein
MASPALSKLEFSMVGDVDSDWYGINLLDSASTDIDSAGHLTKAYSWQTLGNRVDNPISITIAETIGSFKLNANDVIENPTLGSNPDVKVELTQNITINPIERWY